jgi:hypothetical protein
VATVEVITRVCDMPHTESVEGTRFELFWEGAKRRVEVDLCPACAQQLITPALVHARTIANAKAKRPPTVKLGQRV